MISISFKKYSFVIFALLSLGLFLTIFLVNNRTNFFSKASTGDFPKNIQISNITDDSVTISYQTDGKVIGNIIFGIDPDNLDFISIDDRDQLNQISNTYNFHHITLRGLEPNTKYFFSINSGTNNYLNENNFFEFQTGSLITKEPPSQIPAVGNVLLQNGTSPSEGIIYLKTNNSQLTSTLIKNGKYIIPLNSLRDLNFDNYLTINPSDDILIEAFANQEGNLFATKSNGLSPVKDVILHDNYNYSTIHKPTINQLKEHDSISPTPEKTGWNILSIFNL